jgi:Zn-dependent protease with chaperone function
MAAPKVPYPPSPADVPDDLTDFPPSYKSKQNLLLIGLFIFLLFYFGLIVLCLVLGIFCFLTMNHWPAAKVAGMVACGITFLFLVKGFFKRHSEEKELRLEITEDEQPILFGFIHRLCDELDAPDPNRVFVSTDVNAAVIPRAGLINLIKEPKKDLLIGLGLVNCVNLSEFKSVMAHEFGHFCQSGYIASYSYVSMQIILDIIVGEDFLDRFIEWCKRQQNVMSVIGYGIGAPLWIGKKLLELAFKAITMQRLAVSREQEFHADLVAVKAAGSDAVGLSLMRLRFGNLCLMQAMDDLSLAAEHKLYSRDLFYHQDRSEPIVRRLRKEPELGIRPASDDPMAGKRIRVFDPEKEEEEHEEIPLMRRTHPPAHETEENAKETFIPAVVDHRSPWILFNDLADLKERLTYKFYRMAFRVKKNVELVEPEEVQQFIDDEHAETTYDPKYSGIYDGRPIEPGDIDELNQIIRESPWDEQRIDKVFDKLYDDAKGRNEDYQDIKKEKTMLENTPGRPGPRLKKKIKKLEKELDRVWEWFQSLDRRVYLCHVQMGAVVNAEWRDELVERYRFGLEIQRFYVQASEHAEKAFFFTRAMLEIDNPHPDFIAEFMQVLRKAWKTLKNIVQDAREINMPAMKNFEEGERLADFILDRKMAPEPPLHIANVRVAWVQKLVDQLRDVRRRCGRLHWKSVGGILALQEKIAAAWKERHAPIEATIVEEPIAAILLPAQTVPAAPPPVEAEILDAEPVLLAEILDAEVLVEEQPARQEAVAGPARSQASESAIAAGPVFAAPMMAGPPPLPDPDPALETEPMAEPEPVFQLPAEEPVAAAPPPLPTPLERGTEPFSLDLDAGQPAQSEESPSTIGPLVALTPLLGETITKPAKKGRPPIKITYLRPGEKSPLAK